MLATLTQNCNTLGLFALYALSLPEGRKDSKGEKNLKYTSSLTNLLSWEFLHYLLKYKRPADMQTSQHTGKHARIER